MNTFLREFRLIPIVLVAVGCLFALKAMGLLFDGGYTLRGRNDQPIVATLSSGPSTPMASPSAPLNPGAPTPMKAWMQETFFPEVTGTVKVQTQRITPRDKDKDQDAAIVTGSAAPAPKAVEPDKPGPKDPPPDLGGTKVQLDQPRTVSASERAIIERLQERRSELDARARELEMRENLLKSAEKKLESQSAEQKTAAETKGSASKGKEEVADTRFKSVVTMYETMKPKEAAKIFDRLDIRVLIEVASQMKPQIMSAVLAQMSPDAAERLTVEMATRAGDKPASDSNLPKIEGKPTP